MIHCQWCCMKLYISAESRVWGRRINRLSPASSMAGVRGGHQRLSQCRGYREDPTVFGTSAAAGSLWAGGKGFRVWLWGEALLESLPLQHTRVRDHGGKQADTRITEQSVQAGLGWRVKWMWDGVEEGHTQSVIRRISSEDPTRSMATILQ